VITISRGRQYENGPYESGCPVDPACSWAPGYPPGYTDPEWEPTGIAVTDEERFSAVMTARQDALAKSINDHFAEHGLVGLRFDFETLDAADG
jgi:hypothetical protein